MTGSRLIGLVVAVLAIGAVAYFVIPSFREKADEMWQKHGGWTDERRRKDPEGFIRYSIGKLEANIAKFDDSRIELRSGKTKVEKMKQDNAASLEFNKNNLAQFKAAYKSAKEASKWPVSVAGRNYSENELKSQVELALSEKSTYETLAGQLEKTCKDLETKEFELVNRITESKSNLSQLKTQAELVKANRLTADSEKILAEVNDVLVRNEAVNVDVAIRTTEEMKKDAAKVATPKADDFLNS